FFVDPSEPLRSQRRPRRAHLPEGAQVVGLAGLQPGLAAVRYAGCRDAEMRDLEVTGELPQGAEIGMARVAVEEGDRRSPQQPRCQVTPPPPARRREPEEAVTFPQIAMQPQDLQMLEEDPSVAVDYGLRLSGGSRGVEDIQRMVERNRCELDRFVGFGQIRPSDGVGNGYAVEVWHGDHR